MQRSLRVAARFLAPCSRTGFRRPALVCRISPSNWGLLPGAPALTRTDLSSARRTRLSGRTMRNILSAAQRPALRGDEKEGRSPSYANHSALAQLLSETEICHRSVENKRHL